MYSYPDDPSGVATNKVVPYKDTHTVIVVLEINHTEVIYLDCKYQEVRRAPKGWMAKHYPIRNLPGFNLQK